MRHQLIGLQVQHTIQETHTSGLGLEFLVTNNARKLQQTEQRPHLAHCGLLGVELDEGGGVVDLPAPGDVNSGGGRQFLAFADVFRHAQVQRV